LTVIKNGQSVIVLDNLLTKEYYIEVAYNHGQMDKCKYFGRKFDLGLINLLENECQFMQTKVFRQGQQVYKEIKTNFYWYLDNLHKNHYEVFDDNKNHIGIADMKGVVDTSRKVNGRTL
jgi:hypothetical protein